MCYSAMIQADYDKYVREFGAIISFDDFAENVWQPPKKKRKRPKAMDEWFRNDPTPEARRVWEGILAQHRELEPVWQQELFKQKRRLAEAERRLAIKVTATALKEQRIATDKIKQHVRWLEDLNRSTYLPRDGRFFPQWDAPVMVMENGRLVVKPMRYQCRIPGMPASSDYTKDKKLSGTYNARRDNLTRYWRNQFGFSHGVIFIERFWENVSRHDMEHRELASGEKEENVRLEFNPNPPGPMVIACIWAHWTPGPNEPDEPELTSFAAITDDPPPEVAATGHDRIIIRIRPERIMDWLQPEGKSLAELQAILDDRPEAYYEHTLEKAA
jgi:putative SOS response-associated peptidase YedK